MENCKVCLIMLAVLLSNYLIAQQVLGVDSFNNKECINEIDLDECYLDDENDRYQRGNIFYNERAYSNEKIPDASYIFKSWNSYIDDQRMVYKNTEELLSSWTALTPTSPPTGGTISLSGVGRITSIAFHPTNSDIIFLGTPRAGLWKSIDGGANWVIMKVADELLETDVILADELSFYGVSSITVDYTNPDVMYIATGDKASAGAALPSGYMPPTVGVIKSIDGGTTWNKTSFDFELSNQSDGSVIYKVMMHPNDHNILFIAAVGSNMVRGLWKTTDAGENWIRKANNEFYDIEFKPGSQDTLYASAYDVVYVSVDNGETWETKIGDVFQKGNISRTELAVTAANPEALYCIGAGASVSGLYGIYKTLNGGNTWSKIMERGSPGFQDVISAQGRYNLTFNIAPDNEDIIFAGGVYMYQSTNGGTSWVRINSGHADNHLIEWDPLNHNKIFCGNDGGISKSIDQGNNWSNVYSGLRITQYYKLGVSPHNASLVFGGAQDNGIHKYEQDSWKHVIAGDGMETIFDHLDSNIIYSLRQNGIMYKSINKGNNFSFLSTPGGPLLTSVAIDPIDSKILYYGGAAGLYKSINGGQNWILLSDQIRNSRFIKIAPSNPNYIYVTNLNILYKSTDNGQSFTQVTSGLPIDQVAITDLTIHPQRHMEVCISFSGYKEGEKVYKSVNAGNSWTNFSGSIPNLPVNCIIYDDNNKNSLYVGTDMGVLYRDANMLDWVLYSDNLPQTMVTDIDIQSTSGEIFVSTFGSGIWKASLYTKPTISGIYTENHNYKVMYIYPNPVSIESEVIITVTGVGFIDQYEIYDLLGRKIDQGKTSIGKDIVLSKNIQKGTYFLRVNAAEEIFFSKLVVN